MKNKLFMFGLKVRDIARLNAILYLLGEIILPAIGVIGIALLMFLMSTEAKAELPSTTSLQVHLASYHIDREKERNEKNFGLGIKTVLPNCTELSAGFYRNSQFKTSYYAAAGRTYYRHGKLTLGMEAGLVSGYTMYDDKFGPMVMPVIGYDQLKLRITPFAKGTIGLSLEVPF